LNFERIIRRKNELTYWSGYSRSWRFWNVSQAGTVTGLEGVRTGSAPACEALRDGRIQRGPRDGGNDYSNESRVGLEDVKVSLSSSITAI